MVVPRRWCATAVSNADTFIYVDTQAHAQVHISLCVFPLHLLTAALSCFSLSFFLFLSPHLHGSDDARPGMAAFADWWTHHDLSKRIAQFQQSRFIPQRHASGCDGCTGAVSLRTVAHQAARSKRPVLLLSACLLGHTVTFRGSNFRAPRHLRPTPLLFLMEVVAKELDLVTVVPLCPEMQLLGLPAPRRPLRLVGNNAAPGVGARGSGAAADVEDRRYLVDSADARHVLLSYNAKHDTLNSPSPLWDDRAAVNGGDGAVMMEQLLRNVDGIILKSSSPSCGVMDARLYTAPPPDAFATVAGGGGSGGGPVAGRRPAASRGGYHAAYQRTNGFFTELLVNSLGKRSVKDAAGARSEPVITSDRLLVQYEASHVKLKDTNHAAADGGGAVSVSAALQGHYSNRRSLVGLPGVLDSSSYSSLDLFMASVLRHHRWRQECIKSGE